MAVLALFWPLVFLVYLFNAAHRADRAHPVHKPRPWAGRPGKGKGPETMMIRNGAILCFACILALAFALGGCGDDKGGQAIEHDEHGFPASVDAPVGKLTEKDGKCVMVVHASAYTLRPEETKDYDIGVAAWGDKLEPGMKAIAVSRDLIPLGLDHNTKVTIRGLPGKYRVLDKMNKRFEHKIDICFGDDVALAKEWGKRKVVITWEDPEG